MRRAPCHSKAGAAGGESRSAALAGATAGAPADPDAALHVRQNRHAAAEAVNRRIPTTRPRYDIAFDTVPHDVSRSLACGIFGVKQK